MLNVFAWIAVVVCPLLVIAKLWSQFKYEGSLEKSMDRINGYESDYMGGFIWLLVGFVVSLVYLIVK